MKKTFTSETIVADPTACALAKRCRESVPDLKVSGQLGCTCLQNEYQGHYHALITYLSTVQVLHNTATGTDEDTGELVTLPDFHVARLLMSQ